jgi:hypothetical protein
MANPRKGEVALPVGGRDFTLRLSVNALAEVEGLLDKGVNEIIQSLDRVTTLRALLWAGLRQHHPDVSLFDAGDLIGEAGADIVGEKIGEALKAAFPEPKGNTNPPQAAEDGTGTSS